MINNLYYATLITSSNGTKGEVFQYLTKENSVVVSEKINQIFQDMKKMCPTDANLELGFLRVFGNVIEIQKCYTDNEPIKIYYEIQADGTIEKVELRRRKKICR